MAALTHLHLALPGCCHPPNEPLLIYCSANSACWWHGAGHQAEAASHGTGEHQQYSQTIFRISHPLSKRCDALPCWTRPRAASSPGGADHGRVMGCVSPRMQKAHRAPPGAQAAQPALTDGLLGQRGKNHCSRSVTGLPPAPVTSPRTSYFIKQVVGCCFLFPDKSFHVFQYNFQHKLEKLKPDLGTTKFVANSSFHSCTNCEETTTNDNMRTPCGAAAGEGAPCL